MALRAGVARVPLDPPLGVPLMGYGARTGVASGVHDPLFARALYVAAETGVLLVVLDVCLVAPAQARAVRERIAQRAGVPVERITVLCTHTHSGPETGLADALDARPPAPYVEAILAAAVRAGEEAVAAAATASLGVGCAAAGIGRNRRRAAGPVDPEVPVVRIDREDGSPLAVLYIHGCHPTALGHDNLAYSADWPGAASRRIEAELPGATAIFALGAHADVDPRTRGLLDVAREGQSVGVGFAEMARLGEEVGAAVAGAAGALATHADADVAGAAALVRLTTHPGPGSAGERRARLAASRAAALALLELDPAGRVRSQDLFRLAHERTRGLPVDERRERIARVRLDLRDRQAAWFAGGAVCDVEVQVLRLGPLRLLALPLEATVDVGLDWKGRAPGPAAVLSIANGWLRYLPHARNFAEENAHHAYEILTSTFTPGAADALLEMGGSLLPPEGAPGQPRSRNRH